MDSMKKLFCMLLLSASATAAADVVVLNNGDRLSGVVDSIDGEQVLLKTDYAGIVPINMDAIVQLETDQAFDIDVGGTQHNGRFAFDGQQQIVTDEQTQPVELAAVSRAGQNRLKIPSLGREWTSRADVALVISNGNSDTQSLNTLVESTLTRDRVEHAVSLLVANEEAEEETTKEQFDLDYAYKRFLSEQWYASGNAEYFRDDLKGIDQRVTLGAGMGYQFWDDSFGSLSTEVGISAVQEKRDGAEETDPAIRWGLAYKRFLLAKKLELFHKQSVLYIPDSDRGEVLSSSSGARYALSNRIDTTARVDVRHETEPSPGNSKTDVTYTLGVGVRF